MIRVRDPQSIYLAKGQIENGTFSGRWHFSFDRYYDLEFERFGNLRVFNDDTLSPGAVWPLHPHREIEVVTYCARGDFRHADEHGVGGILKKGWVQHTTVGKGMWHSEINNKKDQPMRFIQMWFFPEEPGLTPSVEQKEVKKGERTNTFLPLVSNTLKNTLPIRSDVAVYSCFLEAGKTVVQQLDSKRGYYLYLLEGGPVVVKGKTLPSLSAAMVTNETKLDCLAKKDSEVLLVDVGLFSGLD